uniref:17-beta-hydroxysteroid dehydrogenase type 6 n=1 Tax=Syphacia muris TaxID=451379 RepID=A0A0N5AQ98_9BILA
MFDCCLVKLVVVVLFLYYAIRYILELIPVKNLYKKAIFITGCDSGFGHEFALYCAKRGIYVFAGCLENKVTLLAVNRPQTRNLPGTVEPLKIDVTNDESVLEAREFIRLGLWALVNNAGILPAFGPADWSTVDDFITVLDVNTFGVIRVTLEFLPLLKQSKGRVVTTTSVLSRVCFPGIAQYQCSKFATAGFMDTLRQEVEPFGIKCSIIEPEIFDTPLIAADPMEKSIEDSWNRLNLKKQEEYGEEFKNYCNYRYKSTKIEYVVKNYYHAVTALLPRNRYYCGWRAIFFYIPLSLLPTAAHDLIIRLIFGQKLFPAVCVQKKIQ